MKKITVWIGIIWIIIAFSTKKDVAEDKNKTVEVVKEDSLEYEVEIFDLRFDSWYVLHNSPAQYRTQTYYEVWNRRYVDAWNYNAVDMQKNSFFDPIIGYDPTIDYGFELNHKLFYYFQYVENVLKIPIMSGGPNAVPF